MSSDNIDYAELDRAVNEAMRAQPVTASTSRAPIPKPKTTTVRRDTAPTRPQGHGRIIDFAPRNTRTHTTNRNPSPSLNGPARRPITSRPEVRQQHPTATGTSSLATTKVSSRVATVRKATPSAKTPTISTIPTRPSVAAKIQQKQQRITSTTNLPEKTKPSIAPKVSNIKDAPDANSYSLGGRSPFLTDTKVEKRPLGNNIPETSITSIRSTKNIYSQKNPAKAPITKHKKHTVTEAPQSHSGWLWTLIVILVIAAGAGLGYLAYLIVFANQL